MSTVPEYLTLRKQELDGRHLVQAGNTLTLGDLKVSSDAAVRFKAGKQVVLGDGFQVGSNSRVVFEVAAIPTARSMQGDKN